MLLNRQIEVKLIVGKNLYQNKMELKCIQIYPIGDQDIRELQRFIKVATGFDTQFIQVEQASFDTRVGYVAFPKEMAEIAVRKLDDHTFDKQKIHARIVNLTDDSPGIPIRSNGAPQNSTEDANSRYYPGQNAQNGPLEIRRPSNSNRRSYQQQNEDPRNFGMTNQSRDYPPPEDDVPQNYNRYPIPSNAAPPPPPQSSDRNRDSEKSKSKESKHKKKRRSSYSSESSSDSSDSPRQSKHKHKPRHHRHHKSKKDTS